MPLIAKKHRPLYEGEEIGRCEYCGDEDIIIFGDTKRCDDCERQFVHCLICRKEQNRDYLCRHVFETDCGEFAGSGADTYDFAANAKDGFDALLRRMHPCFAGDLWAAIRSGKFHTFACVSMLGGGSIEMHGMPKRRAPEGMDPYYSLFFWGNELVELGSGEYADEVSDGYHWMASLYNTETPKANQITLAWIEAFLAGRTDRAIAGAAR